MKVDGLNYNNERHSNEIWNFLPFKGPGFPTRFYLIIILLFIQVAFCVVRFCVYVCLFVCLLVLFVVVLFLVPNDARVSGLSILY